MRLPAPASLRQGYGGQAAPLPSVRHSKRVLETRRRNPGHKPGRFDPPSCLATLAYFGGQVAFFMDLIKLILQKNTMSAVALREGGCGGR
jgi:hypothetical protein